MSVEWNGGRRYVFIESKARTSERIQPRKGKKKSPGGADLSGMYCIYLILGWINPRCRCLRRRDNFRRRCCRVC